MKPLKIKHKVADTRYELLDTVQGGYNFLSRKGNKRFITKKELKENYIVTKWEKEPPVYIRGESVDNFIERAME